jgi:hypothetical protein
MAQMNRAVETNLVTIINTLEHRPGHPGDGGGDCRVGGDTDAR